MRRTLPPPGLPLLLCLASLLWPGGPAWAAKGGTQQSLTAKTGSGIPIDLTADSTTFIQNLDIYEAEGHVVIVQGTMRLTADKVTMQMLSGTLIAVGHVHLVDTNTEIRADRLELNVNTDASVITNGKMYMKDSNTLVTGRLLQRFSETHFRAKEGSFTNCDAKNGETPAWRFTFEDVDINMDESFFGKNLWLCVNDYEFLPIPQLSFPIQTARKSGFLVPTIGYDNRFGFHYRHGFFWALSPSQDVQITPDILTNRGYGGDLEYRYILDRKSKGQWLVNFIQDTEVNRARALIAGTHTQTLSETLSLRAAANLLTDRSYLNDLSLSGVARALPSQDSFLSLTQRLATGNLYLNAQYLQPVGVGGKDSFQRLPELGHRMVNVPLFGSPLLFSADSTVNHFYREEGFALSRADIVPSLTIDPVSIGQVVALAPQVKVRESFYTRSTGSKEVAHRETFWAAMEATSRLARTYTKNDGQRVQHTIEPRVIYEYVPPTDQSDIVQVDDVDNLLKKNLVTYSLRSRLLGSDKTGSARNLLDITIGQSYQVGAVQTRAREFPLAGTDQFTQVTQPIQPATVAVTGKKFSDIWARAVIGDPLTFAPLAPGQPPPIGQTKIGLTVDAFFNPYRGSFSQFNTDLRLQRYNAWYLEVGQRFTNSGNRVRRGDIWNPLSFGEVFAPTREVDFVTIGGAFRTPLGWTIGAKSYYDIRTGNSPEIDVAGVYQNDCRCWSLGLYYIKFQDRMQYNFMISLTGVGATESFGTQLVKTLLSPILQGERGLPWPAPYVKRQVPPEPPPASATLPSAP